MISLLSVIILYHIYTYIAIVLNNLALDFCTLALRPLAYMLNLALLSDLQKIPTAMEKTMKPRMELRTTAAPTPMFPATSEFLFFRCVHASL